MEFTSLSIRKDDLELLEDIMKKSLCRNKGETLRMLMRDWNK